MRTRQSTSAADVLAAYRELKSAVLVAGRFGLSPRWIRTILHKKCGLGALPSSGTPRVLKRWRLNPFTIKRERLIGLLEQFGNSVPDAAKSLRCSSKALNRRLRQLNLSVESDKKKRILAEIEPERLRELFHQHNNNTVELSKTLGVHRTTLLREFRVHGIKAQPGVRKFPYTYEWLHLQYVTKKLTVDEIAAQIGVCRQALWRQLVRYGIPRRPSPRCPPPQPTKMLLSREDLEKIFLDKSQTSAMMARAAGVSVSVFYRALRRYGIKTMRSA